MMATNQEVGARLAQAREAKGLSREQLAKRAGVSLATVQHHENGLRGIRSQMVETYRRVLNFSVDWLYTGSGGMSGHVSVDPEAAEVASITQRLSEDRKRQLADYAKYLDAQQRQEVEKK